MSYSHVFGRILIEAGLVTPNEEELATLICEYRDRKDCGPLPPAPFGSGILFFDFVSGTVFDGQSISWFPRRITPLVRFSNTLIGSISMSPSSTGCSRSGRGMTRTGFPRSSRRLSSTLRDDNGNNVALSAILARAAIAIGREERLRETGTIFQPIGTIVR